MSDFRKYLNKQLDNKEFKKEWDNSKNEYDLAKSQVAARKEDVTWKQKHINKGHNKRRTNPYRTGRTQPVWWSL